MALFKLGNSLASARNAIKQMMRTGTEESAPDAFFFHLHHGQMDILELNDETKGLLSSKGLTMSTDAQSTSLRASAFQPGCAIWHNGKILQAGKEVSCINGDLVTLQAIRWEESEFLLYSVLNQKDTQWIYSEDADDETFSISGGIPAYTSITNSDRHMFFDGVNYYKQQPLEEKHHAALPLLAKQLEESMLFSIDINARYAGSGSGRKKLLENIHLELKPREMVLVLGGSGAGKTTFFDTVMGTEKGDATILVGERDLYANYEKMKQMIGYVRQNNVLRLSDSVYKTLESIACTRLPKPLTDDKELLHRLIMEALRQLSIDSEADNLVGKLSGGQLRRLSIAAEYISAPPLFFLDEPDSGLDPLIAKTLMHTLREIADKGKIVIVITHTPDRTPELFDKVLVLAKSKVDDCGKMAYFGTVEGMRKFFWEKGAGVASEGISMEDITFEDVERAIEEYPDQYIDEYAKEFLS